MSSKCDHFLSHEAMASDSRAQLNCSLLYGPFNLPVSALALLPSFAGAAPSARPLAPFAPRFGTPKTTETQEIQETTETQEIQETPGTTETRLAGGLVLEATSVTVEASARNERADLYSYSALLMYAFAHKPTPSTPETPRP